MKVNIYDKTGDTLMHKYLRNIPTLSSEKRLEVEQETVSLIKRKIGDKPQLSEFSREVIHDMPSDFRKRTRQLMFLSLGAAFFLSAARLMQLGFEHASKEGFAMPIAFVAGVAVILIAEASQLIFLLAFADKNNGNTSKSFQVGGASLATLIALAGNGTAAANSGNLVNVFDYLITFGPPLIVIGVGWILKDSYVSTARRNQAIKVKYDEAMNTWQERQQHPKQHQHYMVTYASLLREVLAASLIKRKIHEELIDTGEVDKDGKPIIGLFTVYGRDMVNELDDSDWSWLISREIDAGNWFRQVETRIVNNPQQKDIENENFTDTHQPESTIEVVLSDTSIEHASHQLYPSKPKIQQVEVPFVKERDKPSQTPFPNL